jgi:opacity protein-like surface antigen
MKKLLLPFVLALCLTSTAQTSVSRGNLGFGLHAACPQNELKEIKYDEGIGINMSYLSRKFPYKSEKNFQIGVRMDFANMQSKSFDVELATPVPDDGVLKVHNNMYGLFLEGRFNYGIHDKVVPFASLLVGHRNYSTNNTITSNNPELNPDIEGVSYNNRIVHTQRFHYGGSIGVSYKLNEKVSFDAGATYTIGEVGAVLPLKDVVQSNGGNEIYYHHTQAQTDILLINLGVRIELFKHYRQRYNSETTNPEPSNKRYRDVSPAPSDQIIRDKPTPKKEPVKKTPLEIKPDGPKKKPNVNH